MFINETISKQKQSRKSSMLMFEKIIVLSNISIFIANISFKILTLKTTFDYKFKHLHSEFKMNQKI